MTSNKTVQEFGSTTKQRLYEASKFWSDCDGNYHDLKEFVASLNALIQSLRNLTFIIQSYKSIIPDFDDWYTAKQDEMREDIYLRWAHESRNIVVKSSNLKLKSKTTIALLNWEFHPVQSITVDPLNNNTEIRNTVLAKVSTKDLVAGLRDPIVRIERYWIADNMPEKELLWLTAYCYRYFKKMIVDINKLLGLDTHHILSNFEKSASILNENTLFEGKRTVVLDLKDMKRLSREFLRVGAEDKKLEKKVKERYGTKQPKYDKKDDKVLDWFELVTEKAKHVIEIDGYHLPMAFLFGDGPEPVFNTLEFRDRAELYYMFRKLGDDILEKRFNGAVVIIETWIKDKNFRIRGDCVVVAAVKKGFVEVRLIPFEKKKGRISVKPIVKIKDKANVSYLKPIIEAIDTIG